MPIRSILLLLLLLSPLTQLLAQPLVERAWLVAHELLGNPQARLYDGSVVEWTARPALPMVEQIRLRH